jgi:CRP-like cAMP-binding protein
MATLLGETLSARRLDGIVILRDLPAEARAELAGRCRWRRYAAGETIIGPETPSGDVVLVVEGKARVVDRRAIGREVCYAEIGPGGHAGELAALDGGPRSACVVAAADSLICIVPAAEFRRLLRRHAEVAEALLAELANVIRAADRRISELSTVGVTARLCRELLRRATPSAREAPLVIRALPTQEVLACGTAATRETVARIMAQLAHDGIVRRQGRTLLLLDPDRLEALAELRRNPTAALT